MDPQDPNVPGELVETPPASPAETITPGEGTAVNPEGAANPNPEEVMWNSLKGSAQERFREVTRENNRLRSEIEEQQRQRLTQMVPQNSNPTAVNPEVRTAVQQLAQVGIATDEKVDQKIDQRLSGLVYQMELERLENRFDGADGRPKFDRDEYQDYVSRHPQYRNYSPEDVYEKMYSEELFDWKTQNQGRPTAARPLTTLRPTKTVVKEEPLSKELIEQRLSEPGGREWYEKHISEINNVLSRDSAS